MYHLYQTEALVLGGEPHGEGSRRLTLFTRELGLLSAVAASVREERSKLRYGLQNFSYATVSLVRGRDSWRVTNAALVRNLARSFQDFLEARELFARVAKLLRRLLAGEEKNEPLFRAVLETFAYLEQNRSVSLIAQIEVVLVLRILSLLGYLAPRKEFEVFLVEPLSWSPELFGSTAQLRALALAEINRSLRETQL